MKIKLSIYLALGVCVLCMSSLTVSSYATNVDHAATICKNWNAAEATDIDYLPYGVRNVNANTRYVVCPIVRSDPGTSVKLNVFVDGYASPGVVYCTLYSATPEGDFNGQSTGPMTGAFHPLMTVQENAWMTASVLCALPGNTGGMIYDLNVQL
jgi:hypothetical protein